MVLYIKNTALPRRKHFVRRVLEFCLTLAALSNNLNRSFMCVRYDIAFLNWGDPAADVFVSDFKVFAYLI